MSIMGLNGPIGLIGPVTLRISSIEIRRVQEKESLLKICGVMTDYYWSQIFELVTDLTTDVNNINGRCGVKIIGR